MKTSLNRTQKISDHSSLKALKNLLAAWHFFLAKQIAQIFALVEPLEMLNMFLVLHEAYGLSYS